jgi:hypothetical protein
VISLAAPSHSPPPDAPRALSPRDASTGRRDEARPPPTLPRADPELGLGRFDEALEDVKKAVDGAYRTFYAYINLAAANAFKGAMDEAKAAMAEALLRAATLRRSPWDVASRHSLPSPNWVFQIAHGQIQFA